ncbi:hypothetical protein P170DRAFT_480478 [Aspergillus steynii IBT 23096]|uniref:Tat pathway signal sequence n=1 Tax=Aspergillus steynii IBT 23096 TaxID=1392250 RepID=A0A2I2FSA9_9EURO|nr:uncharacterized protein P170DRAFT_480478 [Aspergillus steynii IBT 23096]PLB43503.1 hypothetical protein P170DRAFT_480478 [Aspergillus steynii IBT 23096]
MSSKDNPPCQSVPAASQDLEKCREASLETEDGASTSPSSFIYRDRETSQVDLWSHPSPSKTNSLHLYRRLSFHLVVTNTVTLLFALWILYLYRECLQRGCQYQKPRSEIRGVAEIPVEWTTRKFRTGVEEGGLTDFIGGWNEHTNAAWDTILDAGLIKLTEDQAKSLPYNTTRNPQDPSTYVGALEVFHQLHCLNNIRHGYYVPEARDLVPEPGKLLTHAGQLFFCLNDETALTIRSPAFCSLDHCFDYLRQNIMCWSDTTISSLAWSTVLDGYYPRFDPVKECLDFEQIHAWATRKENWLPNDPIHESSG